MYLILALAAFAAGHILLSHDAVDLGIALMFAGGVLVGHKVQHFLFGKGDTP